MKQRQSRGLMPWILTLLCAVLLTVWVLGSMPAAPKEGAAVAAGTAYLDSAAAKDASAIAETLREREKQAPRGAAGPAEEGGARCPRCKDHER